MKKSDVSDAPVAEPLVPSAPSAVPLPPRPARFQGLCDFVNPMADGVRPTGSPRNVEFVGAVEWAWSPMHSRADSYYLGARRTHWLLWICWQDDNSWDPKSQWTLYAYGPKRGVAARDAAIYLLLDAWRAEREKSSLGPYHFIEDTGMLSVDDLEAVAEAAWGEEPGETGDGMSLA